MNSLSKVIHIYRFRNILIYFPIGVSPLSSASFFKDNYMYLCCGELFIQYHVNEVYRNVNYRP